MTLTDTLTIRNVHFRTCCGSLCDVCCFVVFLRWDCSSHSRIIWMFFTPWGPDSSGGQYHRLWIEVVVASSGHWFRQFAGHISSCLSNIVIIHVMVFSSIIQRKLVLSRCFRFLSTVGWPRKVVSWQFEVKFFLWWPTQNKAGWNEVRDYARGLCSWNALLLSSPISPSSGRSFSCRVDSWSSRLDGSRLYLGNSMWWAPSPAWTFPSNRPIKNKTTACHVYICHHI